MAHTSAQRDQHALCDARKKNGERCRKFAGEGTSHPGIGACKYHGGSTRNHLVAAIRVEAARRSLLAGDPMRIDPSQAILDLVYAAAGHVAWLRGELDRHEDASDFDAKVTLTLYNDERDRLARVAKAALDSGAAERAVSLAEAYGESIATVLRGLVADLDPYLSAQARKALPTLLRRHLLALEGASEAPEMARSTT